MSLRISDDYGNQYIVEDPARFRQHLIDFHSKNGEGDYSLHEENGYWFTVTPEFYNRIMQMTKR